MLPYIIGISIMFIVFVTVGLVMGTKVKDIADYYVAGRRAGTLLVVGTLISSYLSTVAFMGEVAYSYDGFPISYLILVSISSMGYFFGAKYFGVYLRRSQAFTLPEFFGRRFNSERIRLFTSIITVFGIGCYLASVTQGAALLMQQLIGCSYLTALLIIWVIYTSFTFYSGSNGIVLTETIMFLIFTIMAFLSVPFIIKEAGGWPSAIIDTVLQTDKPGILSYGGVTKGPAAYMGGAIDTVMYGIVLGIVWFMCVSCSPWQASRYLLAKNEHVVIRAGISGMIIIMLMMVVLHITVTTINVFEPDITPSELCYVQTALERFPVWLGIIVCGGLMSAALSSCATFISLIGFSISNDIFRKLIQDTDKETDEKRKIRNSRIAMLASGLVILVITYFQPPAVMWIAYFASTVFAVSWGVTAFMSVWSAKISESGAFYSMVCGACVFVICRILITFAGVTFPTVMRPELLGFIASIAGYKIFNRPGDITAAEKERKAELHVVPESADSTADRKRDLLYAKILIACGILLFVGLFILYYLPYQDAIAMQD